MSNSQDGLPLSPREKRMLRRLAKGMSDHMIAVQLGGKADQVAAQRQRLCLKLQINSQAEVIEAAARLAPWPPSLALAANGPKAP
jgi:DNA-binding CsgD family transcriptional regulator